MRRPRGIRLHRPGLRRFRHPWPVVGLLALLCLGCELARLCPLPGNRSRVPEGIGSFFPVVLAAVFLLPPAAAALVALPGGFAQAVVQRPARVRRVWHAAQQATAAWAAGWTFALLGGPAALGGSPFEGSFGAAFGGPGRPARPAGSRTSRTRCSPRRPRPPPSASY